MNTFTSKALLKKLRSKKKAMVQTVQALGDSLSSKLQPDTQVISAQSMTHGVFTVTMISTIMLWAALVHLT